MDNWSLKDIKRNLLTAADTYLVGVSLPNLLIQYQIDELLDYIKATIQANHSPQDTPTKNISSDTKDKKSLAEIKQTKYPDAEAYGLPP